MEQIRRYFPSISEEQDSRLQQFAALLAAWNQRINLISRRDMPHLEERHILHSLSIARFVQFRAPHTILDVGTGGGFPGIPLAIMYPSARFRLMDSTGKKIRAVEEMAGTIGLQNVLCLHGRAEEYQGRVDFVVARAVTDLSRFTGWIRDKLNPPTPETTTGLYYLKGGDLRDELSGFGAYRVHELASVFDEPFFQTKKLIFLPARSLHPSR